MRDVYGWVLGSIVVALAGCAPPSSDGDAGGDEDARDEDGAMLDASDASSRADVPRDDVACPDLDGDGFLAAACGGNDCDDADALRYPGNVERCEGTLPDGRAADRHDEDCDPCTLTGAGTDGDGDADRRPASTCSNPWGEIRPDGCDATITEIDDDGMTVIGTDCDDARADVYGGLVESCDMVDNDCDLATDESIVQTVYRDADGDLHGNALVSTTTDCTVPMGYVLTAGDCDDSRGDRNPSTVEACDGVDNDCDVDGTIDEGVGVIWHRDADGDGQGAPSGPTMTQCFAPMGYVGNIQDCDDTRRDVGTGFSEACDLRDNDCDMTIDESGGRTYWQDADGDGFGDANRSILVPDCDPPPFHVNNPSDCNDADASSHPGGTETCDGRDNDCSGGALGAGLDRTEDFDGDRHAPVTATCTGGSFPRDDCNDASASINPGALETCDGFDNDCSGTGGIDPAEDADGDAHAPPGAMCLGGPLPRDDCDDGDASVHPGAAELCDREDSNCSLGGGVDPTEDSDADGHAGVGAACSGGAPRDDCNDASATVYLGAPELCDRVDNDCSFGGGPEPGEDADLDGHAPVSAMCSGGSLPRDDCNDTAASTYPGAMELCDRVDTDCSSGGGADTVEDGDGDAHSPIGATCTSGFPRDDCNDGNGSVFPGAIEACDGIDSDCSAGGGAEPTEDADGDLHVASGASCVGGVLPRDDCDDGRPTVYPSAPEICDGRDSDCSSGGGALTGEDADGDAHAAPSAMCSGGPFPRDDCNDAAATIYLGATELCDGRDNDCSSGGGALAAEDVDGDMHSPTTATCTGGPFPRDDCNDAVASTYPGASELCDRVDSNCSSGGGVDGAEDADSDSHAPIGATCSGGFPADDCDDADASRHPGFDSGPRGLSPESGFYTGRGTTSTRPTFRWSTASGGCGTATYEVQIDESCTTPDFPTCTFPSPTASATGLSVRTFTPAVALPISATSPVGRRYYWRVRACEGASCSPWSVRYLEVGRLRTDISGDGFGDVVIGAPAHRGTMPDEGRAYAYYGATTGLPATAAATVSIGGLPTRRRFGASVAYGDVNADGYADVLIGAPGVSGTNGAFYLYFGNVSGLPAAPNATFTGPSGADPEPMFGHSMATSDVNGDGFADVAVAAPSYLGATGRGLVRVYLSTGTGLGTITALAPTAGSATDYFGWVVSAVGDVDGDGRAELGIAAPFADPSTRGAAFLYGGTPSGVTASPIRRVDPPLPGSGFAWEIAGADFDADGFSDVAVTCLSELVPPSDYTERVYVYRGAAGGLGALASYSLSPPTAGELFGTSMTAADFDRDGDVDLEIGAPTDASPGTIVLFNGTAGGISTTGASMRAVAGTTSFGANSTAADVNGDGFVDVVVGAPAVPFYAFPPTADGSAFVFHGSASGLAATPATSLANPGSTGASFGICDQRPWPPGWAG